MGKEKEKGFPARWAGGDFGPSGRKRARQAAHLAHQRGRQRGTVPWRGPTCQREEEGLTARSGRRRGGSRPGLGRR
jgi:hypothetical protein